MRKFDRTLSVAPMMNWTDRHCRYFNRLLSENVLLFTEMITASAVVKGDRLSLLGFHPRERPLVLQLGGSDLYELSEATKIGFDFGYDEVNLNVGCPSGKVQCGCFGAVLMKQPKLVADCVRAMKNSASNGQISVKCRIGVDDQRPELELPRFLEEVVGAGADSVTIHARKALLKKLSPKENRVIPELDYPLVISMVELFPSVELCINGGIKDLDTVENMLSLGFAGVMIGRAAYNNTREILLKADEKIFKTGFNEYVITKFIDETLSYIDDELRKGVKINRLTRHLAGTFNGLIGAKRFRKILLQDSTLPNFRLEILRNAMQDIVEKNKEFWV